MSTQSDLKIFIIIIEIHSKEDMCGRCEALVVRTQKTADVQISVPPPANCESLRDFISTVWPQSCPGKMRIVAVVAWS